MCRLLATVVRRAVECESVQVLHPYFNDVALFAASNVNDPFPAVKVDACALLVSLSKHVVEGTKHYANGLVRQVKLNLDHRHAKVVDCFPRQD